MEVRMDRSSCKALSNASGPTLYKVKCPICGPEQTVLIGTSNNLPIVRCGGCDLIYVSECPSVSDTLEFFREVHMKDARSTQVAYVDYRKKVWCESQSVFVA